MTTEERRAFLRRDAYGWVGSGGLIALCGGGAFLSMSFARDGETTGLVVCLGASLLLMAALVALWFPRVRESRAGEKEIVRGLITRKWQHHRARPIYFVAVGDSVSRVMASDWERLHVGDLVEIHRTAANKKAFVVYRRSLSP